MSMTPRERVIAQIEHRETDSLPYVLRMEGDIAELLDAHYGSDRWRTVLDEAIVVVGVPSLGVRLDIVPTWTDLYGSVWRTDHRPRLLVKPALPEPTLDGFVFPGVDEIFEPGWKEQVTRTIEADRDHFWAVNYGWGLFERTWGLRTFQGALTDAAGEPDFYAELVARLADHHLAIVEELVDLPVDGFYFSDDWGYQRGVTLGPERWRRFIKPHWKRIYARVHEAGKFTLSHCCGSVREILPDIIEIGLDVLESVQPEAQAMDPYALKRDFGKQITFWGGLGSQSTIPFGSPAEIKGEIAHLSAEMGRGGGYILAPAKPLQPGTPPENAAAILEAFLQQSGVTFP